MYYPGSKQNSGIRQFLINRIPYHTRYFELFAGSAKLFFEKKPAKASVLSDLNNDIIAYLVQQHKRTDTLVLQEDALSVIDKISFTRSDFIYLDPPYPAKARRSGARIYKHEMLDDDAHIGLLNACNNVDANIMISTRQNDLYDELLKDWRKDIFNTVDHAGRCQEIIYMNYPAPVLLHQYDYLGNDFIDRQRIKRKVQRFQDKLQALPSYEKHLFIQQLIENDTPAVQHFLSMTAGKTNRKHR